MSKKIRYPLFALVAILALVTLLYFVTRKRPCVVLMQPEKGALSINEHTSISLTIINLSKGINKKTLNSETVFLREEKTNQRIPVTITNTVSNIITLTPNQPLKLNTTYVLHVTSDVEDLSGFSFAAYSSSFTTGTAPTADLLNVSFEKLPLPNTTGQYTSLTIGPDGKLYALGMDGLIKRFLIHEDGTLSDPELIYSLQDAYGPRTQRLAIGLAFDPSARADSLVAYVTHTTYMLSDAPDWGGKVTRLSGRNLQQVKDLLINLPRSTKDHVTNSVAFGTDGALYFTQGGINAMGHPDKTWSNRSEHLLSAALLRLDLKKLKTAPLDVKTIDAGGRYNPYAPEAPVTIYASGLRNAYDLLWHSNGELYVPTNGSAAGGNTPASVAGTVRPDGKRYNGPDVRSLNNVRQTQNDYLFRVEKGGYYGHPNPTRGEYVLNGGNPTSDADPAELSEYPVGTQPDANWRGYMFDFGPHKSPDGVIEYKSNTFNGALKGKLLVIRYSTTNDILVLTPGSDNRSIISTSEGLSIEGFQGFIMPLDLTEDLRNGNIYVSELGSERISLLRPKANSAKSTGETVRP